MMKGFYFGHVHTSDIGVTWPWTIAFYLKTIQNILTSLHAGTQVSDRCPLGYLFSHSVDWPRCVT